MRRLDVILVRVILNGCPSVMDVRVEVEKPGALSAARSVRALAPSQPAWLSAVLRPLRRRK